MIARTLAAKIDLLRMKFPVLSLTGPRQSGKTTLLRHVYNDIPYVSLEDLDNRIFAEEDPRGFLSNYPKGAVIDEIQNVPDLFSYIQGIVDKDDVHFAISGSQNFLLLEKITQSLAGRTAILKLLPFSMNELKAAGISYEAYEPYIFNGGYPRLYDKQIDPIDFFPSYITSYIEKDVRQIKNIQNLSRFSNFLRLCAGRTGQILNIQSLASDAGVSPNTAKSWLSILGASYIIFLLQPFHKNYSKRIMKAPKLYFYDTGVCCSLLGIENESQLQSHYLKGGLFENMVIVELQKARINEGRAVPFYYWQSKQRKEIDLIIQTSKKDIPIEIKAGKTRNSSFLDNIRYWKRVSNYSSDAAFVVYGGREDARSSIGTYLSWQHLNQIDISGEEE